MRHHAVVVVIAMGAAVGMSGVAAAGAFHASPAARPSLSSPAHAAAGAVSSGSTSTTAPAIPPPTTTTAPPSRTAPAPRSAKTAAPGQAAPAAPPSTSAPPPRSTTTTTPVGTGRHGRSTSADTAPVLIAGTYVGREPRQIDFSVDEGNVVTGLQWATWSSAGAVGEGESDYDSCLPNCASAPVTLEATTVALSVPIDGHFTVLTEVRGGQAQRFTFPATWPIGAAQSTPQPTPQSASIAPPTAATGTGTARLSFSGAVAGVLTHAVTSCRPRPTSQSAIVVTGTLNGTPWVLYLESFDGEQGVWEVRTGQANDSGGLLGQGYGVAVTYPATVTGVTKVDWSKGATLDVQLASQAAQTPAGSVTVRGTAACGK